MKLAPGAPLAVALAFDEARPISSAARLAMAGGLGRRHGLAEREIGAVIDAVRAAVSDWPQFAEGANVTRASRRSIMAAHDAVWATFRGAG
jgi:hypothetical protein